MKKALLIPVLFSSLLSAQTLPNKTANYGPTTFRFLDLPMPARASALGGTTMHIWGDDINLAFSNPALLNKSLANQFAFNFANFVADINYGNIAMARHFDKVGTIGASLQYFNYGKFDKRDEYDVSSGTFKAADYCLNIAMAKRFADTTVSIGGAIKTIWSHYDIYKSWGNALDFGITYAGRSGLTGSILVKNLGVMWKSYNKGSDKELLHYDVQLGFSYKVPKAPFRIMAVYTDLTKWNLTYTSNLTDTTTVDPFKTNDPPPVKTKWQKFGDNFKSGTDKFGRHLIFGLEVVLTKNFNLRVGYNYRQHKEMMLPDKRTASGLSLGFGFGINRFRFNYAWAKYNLAGNSHTFSITTLLGKFTPTKKKKVIDEPVLAPAPSVTPSMPNPGPETPQEPKEN